MEFSQPVIELIESRSSWRSYKSQPLEPELRSQIVEYIKQQTQGPFGHNTRFQLIEKDDPLRIDNASFGTYGFIKNALNFIAGVVEKGTRHWEDYGYNLEKIILKMTDLGLGTCWLGGTFKRSEFGPLLKVGVNEVIPAISPVGYGTASRAIRDRVIRWGAKSRTRRPREVMFFDGSFSRPLPAVAAGKFDRVLNMVRLAPSASNRQPWRIVKIGNMFHLYLKRARNYSEMVKAADLQRVDMGIAMCHFDLVARETGFTGKWVEQEPNLDLPELAEYIVSRKIIG
ncbi:MAG: nitroreductase [Candidatus Marinimicrobia bacterium]|nr:nitroreductase [Candidatus Neomarinimicrobiota bacterium]